jgi:hypothetical protein
MLAFLRVPRGTRVDFDPFALDLVATSFFVPADALFDVGLSFLGDSARAGSSVCSSAERLRLYAESEVTVSDDCGSFLIFSNED